MDIASIIPFEEIFNSISNSKSVALSIFNLLKLVRLLRLGRIISYLKINSSVKIGFRAIQLLVFYLLIVHWTACMLYYFVEDIEWVPPFF